MVRPIFPDTLAEHAEIRSRQLINKRLGQRWCNNRLTLSVHCRGLRCRNRRTLTVHCRGLRCSNRPTLTVHCLGLRQPAPTHPCRTCFVIPNPMRRLACATTHPELVTRSLLGRLKQPTACFPATTTFSNHAMLRNPGRGSIGGAAMKSASSLWLG